VSTNTNTLPPLFRVEVIIDLCQKNTLILTPNQRLRNKAIQAWGLVQINSNVSSWKPPRIYSLDQWFDECWQQLQKRAYKKSLCQIISPEQERVLWESITSDKKLMQAEVLAKQASLACKTLKKWELTTESLSSYDSDTSVNLLKEWLNIFEEKLKNFEFITHETSIQVIGEAYTQNILKQEEEIALVGFDDMPPLVSSQLKKMTPNLLEIDGNDFTPTSLLRTSYSDSSSEMKAAAQWAKNIISNATLNKKPRIGIIVPNLGQCRSQVERALTNSFEGHSLLTETPRYTLPYNISAGIPLGKTPLFIDTFLLLKLNQRTWQTDDLYRLLFSNFWGLYGKELEFRALVVSHIQKMGIFSLSIKDLCWQIKNLRKKLNPTIDIENNKNIDSNKIDKFDKKQTLLALESFDQKENNQHTKQLPSQWVDIFLDQLTQLNWPGEKQPDSIEYQQTQLWYQLLESFTTLDSTLGVISVSEAISQLQSMANHQPFQAKVPDSPIQVLGILEGAGLHFTHCWILGLHQQAWPPAPMPNPLLPISLQRQYNMPHASSLRELQFAQSLTDNYKHCATEIVFSSPNYDCENEIELTPSQLIKDIPLQELLSEKQISLFDTSINDFESYIDQQHKIKSTELINCQSGPKVNLFDINKEGILTGGSNIIKAQSINPFDGFAKHRLKIRTSTEAVMGFSAIEKGNILHQTLAFLWQHLQTQQQLLSINNTKLDLLVSNAVSVEINNVIRRKRYHFGKELCQIETERQTELILKWLTYEKTRKPFTVKSIEESYTATIKGYNLHLRLDRIDEITNAINSDSGINNIDSNSDIYGKNNSAEPCQAEPCHLIIDYKTGQCSLKDWWGDYPNDPQLPFYLSVKNLVVNNPVADNSLDDNSPYLNSLNAIAFGQINAKQQTLLGLHHESYNIAEITSIKSNKVNLQATWKQASNEWSRVSFELFEHFLCGDTTIKYNNTNQLNFSRDFISLNRFYDVDMQSSAIENQ
jgi:ATP-dependent helicase/nuclease subunit B